MSRFVSAHSKTSILFPLFTSLTCPGVTSEPPPAPPPPAPPPDWKKEFLWRTIHFSSPSPTVSTLNWKVTECVPKLASNWVLILTAGGLPVAFCTTRNSLVTISMTWPVWKTKSPFLLTASEERQPGMLGWLLSSRVGEDWKAMSEVQNDTNNLSYRSHVEHSDVIKKWT